jgi:hypothetical protein
MGIRATRFRFITISALLLAFTAAVPVQADTELSETGTTGFHALRDSQSRPGASCRYEGVYPTPGHYSYEGKLEWISVRPPKVRAISGSQQVGWRFIVERLDISTTNWVVRYKSPIQRETTSATKNASFSSKGINVTVPTRSADQDPTYEYRVKVKMFWYTANGSVQGTSTHLVDWTEHVYDNWPERYGGGSQSSTDQQWNCRGWAGIEID